MNTAWLRVLVSVLGSVATSIATEVLNKKGK
jgi:hypothetical protein